MGNDDPPPDLEQDDLLPTRNGIAGMDMDHALGTTPQGHARHAAKDVSKSQQQRDDRQGHDQVDFPDAPAQ